MKRILTPQIVARLNGTPIRLSSPYAEGQLLSINEEGVLSLENPETADFDQRWRLIPNGKGFQIISSELGFKVCHQPGKGGIVSAINNIKKNEGGCIWYLNDKGEIYQPDHEIGGEKYLWLAGSHLYVTRDAFLAEKWAHFLPGEKLPPPVEPQYPGKVMLLGIAVLLVLYLVF